MRELIGTTLGHYRIVEKIGEGGMGVVYRAHDERLDRDVAIKVLHESVAQNADRLARFEREAKAVAQLAHPNILEIWDFGCEGGVTYAVTELLDGQNLRQSIPASGLPWQKVAEMGAAIADGLAAAHGKGIVHRDLKPENVFVTSDGRVKVLDFGLAQVKVPVEEEAETATLTPAGTVAGTVMGTMGYMSPEQLRGESSDARSDIFALGCVLYEMLSGHTAFLRNSTAETSAAILKEEPPILSDSGTTLPAELERTFRRCLEKNPEARFQSASDLAYNLRSILSDSNGASRTGELGPHRTPRRVGLGAAFYAVVTVRRAGGAALIGLALFAGAYWWLRPRAAGGLPEFQTRQLTSGLELEAHPAISPDGREVAYAATTEGNVDLWIMDVQGGPPLRLTSNAAHDDYPAWYPDGTALVFVSDRGGRPGLWKTSRFGGEPLPVLPDASDPAVSPDGRRLAFTRLDDRGFDRVVVAPFEDSNAARVLSSGGLWDYERPTWSPDGRTVSYSDFNHLWIVSADNGSPRRITPPGAVERMPAWSADGTALYFSSYVGGLMGIWRRQLSGGTPILVSEGPSDFEWPNLSRDGKWLTFATIEEETTLVVVDTRTGRRTHFAEARSTAEAAVAPDGSAVVFPSDRDNTFNLWRLPLGEEPLAGLPQRITDHGGRCAWPRFSSDGRWIAYYRTLDDGQRDIWTVPTTGGTSRRFTEHPAEDYFPVWTPDGSKLAFVSDRDGGTARVWMAPVRDGHRAGEASPVTEPAIPVSHFAWSPEGQRLAYVTIADGVGDVNVTDVDDPSNTRKLTRGAAARLLRWEESSGRLLVLASWGGRGLSLREVDPETGEMTPVSYEIASGGDARILGFDTSPEGRWLVVLEGLLRGDIWLLEAERGSF